MRVPSLDQTVDRLSLSCYNDLTQPQLSKGSHAPAGGSAGTGDVGSNHECVW